MKIYVIALLTFASSSFAHTQAAELAPSTCSPYIGIGRKGLDQVVPGTMVEIRYRSEFRPRAKTIEAKYIGFSGGGIVYKTLVEGEVVYGTIPLADIQGNVNTIQNPQRVLILSRTLEWADDVAKGALEKYSPHEQNVLQNFYLSFGRKAALSQGKIHLRVATQNSQEYEEVRAEIPNRFRGYDVVIEPVFYSKI